MNGVCDLAIIGMAVMGQNLALNIAGKGYSVAVYNRTPSKTEDLLQRKTDQELIYPTYRIEDLIDSLKKPRKIMLMVKAGAPVDEFITLLNPLLKKGDLIIDGGNSYYKDTERRLREVENRGLLYLGTGISGGEEGALHGPSIMPGGHSAGYDLVQDIFLKAAAQTEDGPCCTYLGQGGAGHFVKMVHNGIEYALMELIAECYDLMRKVLKMEPPAMAAVFERWNHSDDLNSYLFEITANILKHFDQETGHSLIDLILDEAEQKGTGKWTSQISFDFGIPTPVINQAVVARTLSSFKETRLRQSEKYRWDKPDPPVSESNEFLSRFSDALFIGILVAFNEGMHLLSTASREKSWNLPLPEIARIWKGGCILRTRLLNRIQKALSNQNHGFLLESPDFVPDIHKKIISLRKTNILGIEHHVPLPAFHAVLSSLDGWTSPLLPANLIQAQRDYFGAHTYRRIDREGIFHTRWEEEKL